SDGAKHLGSPERDHELGEVAGCQRQGVTFCDAEPLLQYVREARHAVVPLCVRAPFALEYHRLTVGEFVRGFDRAHRFWGIPVDPRRYTVDVDGIQLEEGP